MPTASAAGGSWTPSCVRLLRWWWPGRPVTDLGRDATAPWRAVAAALRLRPFDLDGICEQIAELRGRRLVRVPIADGLEIQAMWARGAEVDYIVHGVGASPLHREHLILHGLGHMLLGHQGHPAVMRKTQLDMLLPDLDERARRQLGRVVYSHFEEFSAEGFATWVLEYGNVLAGENVRAQGSDAEVALRMSEVLESRRRPAMAL